MKARPKKGVAGKDCSCMHCRQPIKVGQDAYAESWCSSLYCSAKCYRARRQELIDMYGRHVVTR